MKYRRGFTLVETLMALTLTAVLASGGAMLVLDITQAWAGRETGPAFRRHVRGLGAFLESGFFRATRNPQLVREGLLSVPPGSPPGTPPAPHLLLLNAGESVPAPGGGNPDGEGWIVHEPDTGLIMLWRTEREKREKDALLHRTVISPWCESFDILSYDTTRDQWSRWSPAVTDSARDSRTRMTLRMRRHGETAELNLSLDTPSVDAPAY